MKTSEIVFRQNRVVYVLMVLLATLGLTWALWEHQESGTDPKAPRPTSETPANHVGSWARSPGR